MSFLTPVFLLLGLLAGPIILFYMLRLRRREMLVSSTLLWQKLLRDREANAPWQRLRRNLLLLLQLLILAALVLALARPFFPVPTLATGNVVVLLDGSASMQATDVTPSRFEMAREAVRELIGDLGGNSKMTLIEVGRTPRVLASANADQNALRAALQAAQVGTSTANWEAAFALAAGAAQGYRDARIVLVSDGGLPDDLPPLPTETIFLPVGQSGENLAIAALATRDTEEGAQLFASVSNEGRVDRQGLLSLTVDGTLFDSRRFSAPAGTTTNFTWSLPQGARTIEARLSDHEGDFLHLDDSAWAVHEGGVTNRALLVTEGNLFLEQAFALLPGIDAYKAGPESDLVDDIDDPFDLYVFDGVPLPEPLPSGDLLVINPQQGEPERGGASELLQVTGNFSNTVAIRLADSPLMQFVDWRNVHVRQAQAVTAPWARPLVVAEGGPLILTGEWEGRRIAIVTFDLHDSDLPLQIAFPVLMANITGWLSPGRPFDVAEGLRPGDPVGISTGVSRAALIVSKPDGAFWRAPGDAEEIIFTESDQLGLYSVSLQDDSGERLVGSFAVNLFSPAEARIRPAETVRFGQSAATTAEKEAIGQRELWPGLLVVGLVVLLIEWWIHHRGARLPGLNLR
jgi:hypothetical protein